MYLMNTRLDIPFAMNTLSQYLVKPRRVHLITVKHVIRYLKGTIDLKLYSVRDHDYRLYRYTDSNWEKSAADKKRNSSGCYCMGSVMISWFSKKQSSVAISHI